ncbi:hypothetical protein FB107DRAFT_279987 [Schizophyllum commune]
MDQKTPIYAEPFASLFTTIVGAWTKHILGPKPANATFNVITRLEGHRCSCRECASAFNWLANGSGKSLALNRIGAQSRKHLEKELTACATGAATWTMLPGKPQGLRIVKSDAIYAPVEWRARHAKGTSILKSIATDQQELRRVFGAHYQVIMGALDGSVTLQNQAANLPFKAPAAPVVPAPAAEPSTGGTHWQPGHSGTMSQHASSSALPTRKRKASSEEATEKRDSNAPTPDYPMEGIATSRPSGEDVDVPMSDSRIESNTANVDLKETADATMEGSASDASSDDGDEPSVDNPSTDISGDLDRALHDLSRTFTGEIASHKTYLDAPIPGLNLLANDIGPIGLPLNEREAQVVKAGCKQAPFGKGERTVVDKSIVNIISCNSVAANII